MAKELKGIREWDKIRISGCIISETDNPAVKDLTGVVGTVDDEERKIKVWPDNNDDPQLPPDHNGKLWFNVDESQMELLHREEDEVV